MKTICGIDEAGRGCIIGPLIMSGILINEEDVFKLKELGVKDSKLLTKRQRDYLYKEIKKIVKDYKTFIVPVEEIDDALNSQNLNLNRLEAINTAKIINHLKPDKVIIDCPSPNKEEYKNYLRTFLKHEAELMIEHKADLNFIECASASVLSKFIREEEIEKIKKKIKEDFGSGYMSDERTQKFLKENYEKHDGIFRKSWLPYKKHAKKQKNILDF